ncbi:MAG: endoflagellar motor switch protein [Leptospiraceae bacterium]|nr:endoflagellar motor switch protein [Leptospiraceae bacterium]MCP5513168.1 endoflagellar motor switch protein [Leptospiraceae bacterium]
MTKMHPKEKAALLVSLMGENLPKEVLSSLSKEELNKLMEAVNSLPKTSKTEERNLLKDFSSTISKEEPTTRKNPIYSFEKPKSEKFYSSNPPKTSPLVELKKKQKEDLELIIKDEKSRTIALVMCFADPDAASKVIEDFPEKIREEIIHEIQGIDFFSESIRSELESFLYFKYDLIESRAVLSKVKNRNGKTVADLLSRINPHLSFKLFSSIKEKNPEFARRINEHYYTIQDLLYIGRTSLSSFLAEFHPIVLACALKGVETKLKDKILDRCEPWLSKKVKIEIDSMGPISLAEIEESQKAIIESLNRSIETGKIKLWKV